MFGGNEDVSASSNSVELASGRVLPSSHLLNPAEVEAERLVIDTIVVAAYQLIAVCDVITAIEVLFTMWWW